MITRRAFTAAALGLASCENDSKALAPHPGSTGNLMDPNAWTIGPVINGKNYSVGMPLNPAPYSEGWSFDIPQAPGSVHYVTTPYGSLTGMRALVLRYRIEADPGAVLHPTRFLGSPSMLSLYFQRRGDDWSARGPLEAFRWYSPLFHSPIQAGDHELIVPLDANWTAVMTSSAASNPAGFEAAKEQCSVIGMTWGGGDGRGHGVSATGPARFICMSFEVR